MILEPQHFGGRKIIWAKHLPPQFSRTQQIQRQHFVNNKYTLSRHELITKLHKQLTLKALAVIKHVNLLGPRGTCVTFIYGPDEHS